MHSCCRRLEAALERQEPRERKSKADRTKRQREATAIESCQTEREAKGPGKGGGGGEGEGVERVMCAPAAPGDVARNVLLFPRGGAHDTAGDYVAGIRLKYILYTNKHKQDVNNDRKFLNM